MVTWAIARHMIAEGLRMKIALVFLLLIGMLVVGLPFSVSGDASLTGAVQSFIAYSLSASALLLGMLTIFMTRSLSDELTQRQILLVLTKPISRWQYLLGKWLGIMLLNAAFVTTVGITMYGMIYVIKATHTPLGQSLGILGQTTNAAVDTDTGERGRDRVSTFDELELESEVLVARHSLGCILPDFRPSAEFEFEQNREEGQYVNVPNFNPDVEKARLRMKHEARWRVVGPGQTRVFEFSNVLCDRTPGHHIQLRYQTDVSQYPPDEVFRALWRFGDPYKGTPVYDRPVRHVVGRKHTVRVPADAVAEDHTLTVYFVNKNPFEGEPQFYNVIDFRKSNEVQVLFVVGSFGGNLIRLLLLMMCKLAFLAAVGLLMTTVFSFPVACLAAFSVYILAASQGFLADSYDFIIKDYSTLTYLWETMRMDTVLWLVFGNLARYDAVETLVSGGNVSLVWVLQAIAELAVVRSAVALGLAMLLFQRREVAEVSA